MGRAPDGRAASDVVAVVLLVAVTIVLSAMVATVALEMGQDVDPNSLAAANVEFHESADEVKVVFTGMARAGTVLEARLVNLTTGATVANATLTTVGETQVFAGNVTDGHRYRVVLVGQWRDTRQLVASPSGQV